MEYLLAMMRAYLLLANWLRVEIKVDITRQVLPHANPFPKEYARKVLDLRYQPDLDTFIDDYLADNPTRNRELDLLPLFAHLRPEHPHALLHGQIFQDPFLDLIQPVVIRLENVFSLIQLLTDARALLPGHRQNPVDVVTHHGRFCGHG